MQNDAGKIVYKRTISIMEIQYLHSLLFLPNRNYSLGPFLMKVAFPVSNLPNVLFSEPMNASSQGMAKGGAHHESSVKVPRSLASASVRRYQSFSFSESSHRLVFGVETNFNVGREGRGREEKLRYACDSVLDWRDYFDHHTLPLSRRNPGRWPNFPSDYRQVVAKYSDELQVLAHKLLGLISESLGLKSRCIEDAVGDFYQNITISYYPPCPQPELTLGLQAHSDMGAITLLIQDDVGGLQVLKDGAKWVTVKPISHAILVLLADQTEIITNGKYKSCEHRAITNSNRARLSVATFHDPAKTVKISPAPDLLAETSPPKYKGLVYGDYVSSWYTKGPGGKRNLDALMLDS
ncbi:putative 2-oxoglutarate-dependent dioxygenase ANS [Senna tora]|uniref:Putative 2-oxoglutarate-dependent dioxygenase ANS n=1 Tax=Senna tora TaxID=362788 RepID=A0A834U3G1_9FABA|nr:putative 2-oxoglutarate-dependent dioxygenase ANS [Senna tora]